MIKTLLPYAKKYKLFAILTPLSVMVEVLLETRIPLLMANIVDIGIQNKDIKYVITMGLTMMLMAVLSLLAGAGGAVFGARAGMGFGFVNRLGYDAACVANPVAWITADLFLFPAYIVVMKKVKKKIVTEDNGFTS